jgi:two-component system LytT family response regulator
VKVTALIADDEPMARAGLRDMLAGIDWITCVGESASGPATVDAIDTLRPELVFLDIQMPGMLGTDVLRQVTHQPFVVFTTAYAQHAVTAFELGALDYLLKPFGPLRLVAALDRVRSAIGEPVATPALDRLSEALRRGPMSRLFVRSGRSIIPVPISSVAWFEAEGDYISAHVGSSRYVLHLSLNRIEERMDPSKFVRIHRTCIVNLDHVTLFRREGKSLMAILKDGTQLTVSRMRARELRGLGV